MQRFIGIVIGVMFLFSSLYSIEEKKDGMVTKEFLQKSFLANYKAERLFFYDSEDGVDYRATTSGASAVTQDRKGDFFIAANYWDEEIWELQTVLIKLDRDGKELWRRFLSIDDTRGFIAQDIKVSAKNEIYLCGLATDGALLVDSGQIALIKLDANGTSLWNFVEKKSYGKASSMVLDSQNNILITGTFYQSLDTRSQGDQFVMKFTPKGDKVWQSFLKSRANNEGKTLLLDQDQNIYLSGIEHSNNKESSYLAVLDSRGYLLWHKRYHSSELSFVLSKEILYTLSLCKKSLLLQKSTKSGKTLWQKEIAIDAITSINTFAIYENELLFIGSGREKLILYTLSLDGRKLAKKEFEGTYPWLQGLFLSPERLSLIGTQYALRPAFEELFKNTQGEGNIFLLTLKKEDFLH